MARASQQEKMHSCGHVIRKKVRRGHVYEVICGRPGAQPAITVSLHTPHTRPQPRWFCSIHWPKHKEVRFDGAPIEQRPFPGTLIHPVFKSVK